MKKDLTEKCLKAIFENTPEGSYHVYLVDNNSPEPYTFEHPNVTNIRNDSRYSTPGMNFGF